MSDLSKLREDARTKYGITNADDISEDQLKDMIKGINGATPAEAPAEKKLAEYSRTDLEEKAKELGIEDPKAAPNKAALIAAIEEKQAEVDADNESN